MQDTLNARLDALARPSTLSDDTPCRVISVADVKRLADETGLSGRLVEIAALKQSPRAIERLAREELGLARPDETVFLIREEDPGGRP